MSSEEYQQLLKHKYAIAPPPKAANNNITPNYEEEEVAKQACLKGHRE
jgi:hypothetical protein